MRYLAIAYFDGPASRWRRSAADWYWEELPGGLRLPIPDANGERMPEPDPSEVVARREFRWRWLAMLWGASMVKRFDAAIAITLGVPCIDRTLQQVFREEMRGRMLAEVRPL